MRCKQNDYIRRAHTSGLCTTHYGRLRSGRDMDAPIRRYVRPNKVRIGITRRRVSRALGRSGRSLSKLSTRFSLSWDLVATEVAHRAGEPDVTGSLHPAVLDAQP